MGSKGYSERVLAALTEFGPMTVADIAEETGINIPAISMAIIAARKPTAPVRVYLHSWRYDPVATKHGSYLAPRMVFALGNRKDAPRPAPKTHAQKCKTWRLRTEQRVNSVFNIGRRNMNDLLNRSAAATRPDRAEK